MKNLVNKERSLYGKKEKIARVVGLLFGTGAVVTFVCAVVSVMGWGILPKRYLIPILIVYIIILLALLVLHFSKRTKMVFRVIAMTLTVIFLVGNSVVWHYSAMTDRFFDKQYENTLASSELEYSIIALKSKKVSMAPEKKISSCLIKQDEYFEEVKTELAKLSAGEITESDNLSDSIKHVTQEEVDTAAIKTSGLELIEENMPGIYEKLEVVKTFKIQVRANDVRNTAFGETVKPFVVYISGIDSYGSVSMFGRSDVNILAIVDPNDYRILLVNTPRDYYVQLHNTSGYPDKLTHAGTYGIDMSLSTLEDLYGVSIDAYVKINFDSFKQIVNALGGVDVDSATAFTSVDGHTFVVGPNHVNGDEALAFVRERMAFASGDRERGKNQQRLIEAIVNKASSPTIIGKYTDLLASIDGLYQSNIQMKSISALLGKQLDSKEKWSVESISVDGIGDMLPTYTYGNQPLSVIVPDEASVAAAKEKIQEYLGANS